MSDNMQSPQTMPVVPQPSAPTPAPTAAEPRPLTWVEAVLGGFVLPFTSLAFYTHASRTPIIRALVSFFVVATLLTALSTIGIGIGLYPLGDDLGRSFANGDVPEIRIANGRATVNADQPFEVDTDSTIEVILDTTGEVTELDRGVGRQGILLTRTEIHVLQDDGRYRINQLSQLNTVFGDPIVLNQETVPRIWANFSSIMTVTIFAFLLIWNTIIRLTYLASLALALWGVTRIFRKDSQYVSVLVVGLYAIIPAMIVGYLLDLIPIQFICLQTAILLPFWGVGMCLAFRKEPLMPPSAGTLFDVAAGIGFLLVIAIAVDLVVLLPNVMLIMWGIAMAVAICVVAVYGVRLIAKPPAQSPG